MRALVHVGLAVLLVLAPAFCCCNVRWLTGSVAASAPVAAACPSCPDHAIPQTASATPPVKKKTCCAAEAEAAAAPASPEPVGPAAPHRHPAAPACKCYGERPDAALPESAPAVAAPGPTGELLPASLASPAAVPPEHLGLLGGLDPPGWAGVDARSEALFSRHVLRC